MSKITNDIKNQISPNKQTVDSVKERIADGRQPVLKVVSPFKLVAGAVAAVCVVLCVSAAINIRNRSAESFKPQSASNIAAENGEREAVTETASSADEDGQTRISSSDGIVVSHEKEDDSEYYKISIERIDSVEFVFKDGEQDSVRRIFEGDSKQKLKDAFHSFAYDGGEYVATGAESSWDRVDIAPPIDTIYASLMLNGSFDLPINIYRYEDAMWVDFGDYAPAEYKRAEEVPIPDEDRNVAANEPSDSSGVASSDQSSSEPKPENMPAVEKTVTVKDGKLTVGKVTNVAIEFEDMANQTDIGWSKISFAEGSKEEILKTFFYFRYDDKAYFLTDRDAELIKFDESGEIIRAKLKINYDYVLHLELEVHGDIILVDLGDGEPVVYEKREYEDLK